LPNKFIRFSFFLFVLVAAGWLVCLHWPRLMQGMLPGLFFMLGAGSGIFTAANVSYLAKILPEAERALPVSLHGAVTYFLGGLAPMAWGLVLKGAGPTPSVNEFALECFFGVTLVGALGLILLANRLRESPGHVDPLLEGGWLFRPFRTVASLIKLAEPTRSASKHGDDRQS
jgi:MFS family permease